ncbi:MAG: hypothetical protein JXM73_12610, partial [Anaerolineae bacterium]|nr:hypothetical protein [Anaerolineae bacterium]
MMTESRPSVVRGNGWRARAHILAVVVALVLSGFYLTGCLSSEADRVTPTPTKTSKPVNIAVLP